MVLFNDIVLLCCSFVPYSIPKALLILHKNTSPGIFDQKYAFAGVCARNRLCTSGITFVG